MKLFNKKDQIADPNLYEKLKINIKINKFSKEDLDDLLKIYLSIYNKTNQGKKSELIEELSDQLISTPKKELLEIIELALEQYSVGNWLLKIKGMTPTLATELFLRLEIEGKDCATQFLNYCGINNNDANYNKQLKPVVDRIGFIFAEYSGSDSLYSNLYKERLKYEESRSDDYDPEYCRSKARRWTEKIFICHLFTEMYYSYHGTFPERSENSKYNIPEVEYIK